MAQVLAGLGRAKEAEAHFLACFKQADVMEFQDRTHFVRFNQAYLNFLKAEGRIQDFDSHEQQFCEKAKDLFEDFDCSEILNT